ncbi:MAG: aminopeptidase N [Porticoccaceae bacterium]|nr:aminopeptidase N [Porticoccaceae bacterium]
MRLSTLILLSFLISSCNNNLNSGSHIRPAERGLNQASAELRKQQVSNPSYQIHLRLNAQGTDFSGSNILDFDFKPQGSDLTIDFTNGSINQISINGKVSDYQYNGFFISIAEQQLVAGNNRIEINYSHPYSKDGAGLYYFKDPIDDRVYTYSDLEPYDANRIFPIFDQPNLKAKFTLSVDAPATWQVISANRETSITKNADRAVWQFPPTLPISSYIMPVHAGNYASFDLGDYQGIALRLFSRQSNAQYVPVEEWNAATRHGFAFFNDFFGIDYPFGKYDQIAVPDFNSGAMENVGAVTFSDRYCCIPGSRSIGEKSFLTNAILHEQAHMWFGNLVTMDWWDDIWLNESFAEIASYFALESYENFDQPWLEFLLQRKTWGYRDDEYITSHPIKGEIKHTDLVMASIDGITYAKGGSVLRQLRYYIGEDIFRSGLQSYMKKYAYQNTRFQDLLDELAHAAADNKTVNINQWADQWIKTIGVNRVSSELQCSNGQVESLHLIQSGSHNSALLRTHKLQVGLYPLKDQKLQQPTILPVTIEGKRTPVEAATGQPCPALVLPNIGDYAYIKVNLDTQTRDTLAKHLSGIDDPVASALFWLALWDGAMDGEYPVTEHSQIALKHVRLETNNQMIDEIANSLANTHRWIERMNDQGQFDQLLAKLSSQIVELADQRLSLIEQSSKQPTNNQQPSGLGGDEFQIWFDLYKSAIHLPEQLQTAALWLENNRAFSWPLDQRSRWSILSILASNYYPNIEKIIETELASYSSARGKLRYLSVKTKIADKNQKLNIIQQVLDSNSDKSLANRKAMAGTLFDIRDRQTTREQTELVVQRLINEDSSLDPRIRDYLASRVVGSAYLCSEQWNQFVDNYLNSSKQLNQLLVNGLRESQQNNNRCIKAKALLL